MRQNRKIFVLGSFIMHTALTSSALASHLDFVNTTHFPECKGYRAATLVQGWDKSHKDYVTSTGASAAIALKPYSGRMRDEGLQLSFKMADLPEHSCAFVNAFLDHLFLGMFEVNGSQTQTVSVTKNYIDSIMAHRSSNDTPLLILQIQGAENDQSRKIALASLRTEGWVRWMPEAFLARNYVFTKVDSYTLDASRYLVDGWEKPAEGMVTSVGSSASLMFDTRPFKMNERGVVYNPFAKQDEINLDKYYVNFKLRLKDAHDPKPRLFLNGLPADVTFQGGDLVSYALPRAWFREIENRVDLVAPSAHSSDESAFAPKIKMVGFSFESGGNIAVPTAKKWQEIKEKAEEIAFTAYDNVMEAIEGQQ